MTENVVDIPPAKFDETYSGHHITYTFVPDTKQWYWEFSIVHEPIRYYDTASSRHKAIKSAHKQIDRLNR